MSLRILCQFSIIALVYTFVCLRRSIYVYNINISMHINAIQTCLASCSYTTHHLWTISTSHWLPWYLYIFFTYNICKGRSIYHQSIWGNIKLWHCTSVFNCIKQKLVHVHTSKSSGNVLNYLKPINPICFKVKAKTELQNKQTHTYKIDF